MKKIYIASYHQSVFGKLYDKSVPEIVLNSVDEIIPVFLSGENMMWRGLEMDDDLRNPGWQAFSGPYIERNVFPPPVINVKLDTKVGFGAAFRINA